MLSNRFKFPVFVLRVRPRMCLASGFDRNKGNALLADLKLFT